MLKNIILLTPNIFRKYLNFDEFVDDKVINVRIVFSKLLRSIYKKFYVLKGNKKKLI
jgi:hypothetical protein